MTRTRFWPSAVVGLAGESWVNPFAPRYCMDMLAEVGTQYARPLKASPLPAVPNPSWIRIGVVVYLSVHVCWAEAGAGRPRHAASASAGRTSLVLVRLI